MMNLHSDAKASLSTSDFASCEPGQITGNFQLMPLLSMA